MKNIVNILCVGAGGALGCVARYVLTLLASNISFPFGTFYSNILGCFLIGLITEMSFARSSVSPEVRLFLTTGFCGGFTTLSTMVYEFNQFMKENEFLYGSLYLISSIIVPIIAFLIGVVSIRMIVR